MLHEEFAGTSPVSRFSDRSRYCIDGSENRNPGTNPWSLLKDKSSLRSLSKEARLAGILSTKVLFLRDRVTRLLLREGNSPPRLFPDKSNSRIAGRGRRSGTVPLNKFTLKIRFWRVKTLEISGGIAPDK